MDEVDDYPILLDIDPVLTPPPPSTPGPVWTPLPLTPAPVWTPPPPRPPIPVWTPPVPVALPPPQPNLAASARVERILGQWTKIDVLKKTRPEQLADARISVTDVILNCLSMINHEAPLPRDVSPVVNDPAFLGVTRLMTQSLEQFNQRSLFENIVALQGPEPTTTPTAVGFCNQILNGFKETTLEFARLKVAETIIEEDLQQAKAELHQAETDLKFSFRGDHASMLFSIIHGRVLKHMYALPTAPDAPGGGTDTTFNKVFANLLGMLQDDMFDSLWPREFDADVRLLSEANKIGGLGLACQLFALLPADMKRFWFYLSHEFYESVGDDQSFQERLVLDVEASDIVPPTTDEDGDLIMYNVPVDDENGQSEAVLEHEISEMAKFFFSSPFAQAHYVLGRLETIQSIPEFYVEIIDQLKMRIRREVSTEENWLLLETYFQVHFLQPDVDVSKLYSRLKGVTSAKETTARLQQLLTDQAMMHLLGPLSSRWIYTKLRCLMEYGPPRDDVTRRLKNMTYEMARGSLATFQLEQEYIQEQVNRKGARWTWPDDSPELNRRVVALLAKEQGLQPGNMAMAGYEPKKEEAEEEVDLIQVDVQDNGDDYNDFNE